jgi:hypothetical protein
MQQSQTLIVPADLTRLYELRMRTKVVGRPPPISCTQDFKFARVGSRIFSTSENGKFEPMLLLNANRLYFEEMASRGPFLAIATRRCLSTEDIVNRTGLDDFKLEDFGKIFSEALEQVSRLAASQKDENSFTSEETAVTRDQSSNVSSRSSSSSRSSISIMEEEETEEQEIKSDIEDNNGDSDSLITSIRSLSARESWSEGSTEPRSDEEDDAEQWNDWASDESLVDFKSDVSGEHEIVVEEYNEKLHGFEGGPYNSDDYSANASDEDSDEDSEDSSRASLRRMLTKRSRTRPIFRSRDTDSDASRDESGSDDALDDAAAELEAMLEDDRRNLPETPAHQRGKLLIYDTNSDDPTPIFRYEKACPRTLYNSPPIFHPTAPLVVWPLGGGEILFANFTEKTYCIRTLRCSATRSCHVSIQGKFSPCGEYLHLAALEAQEDPRPHLSPVKPYIHLRFQLSTHRLSKRKPARSPPRLIYCIGVPLDSLEELSISPLLYTLTWSTDYTYVSKSQETLHVIRVPLFRQSKDGSSTDEEIPGTDVEGAKCHVRAKEIFLPSSTASRQIHYFPPTLLLRPP